MSLITSFPPLADESARVLILGSMPGVASLTANQYYAHPRNCFWPMMATMFSFNAQSPYAIRVRAMKNHGVALWDVLHQCERVGSLDSAIENGTRIVNNFSIFFKQHPHINLICFNGAEAEKSFRRLVVADLYFKDFSLIRLPSTSPANTLPFEQKLALWQEVLAVCSSSVEI